LKTWDGLCYDSNPWGLGQMTDAELTDIFNKLSAGQSIEGWSTHSTTHQDGLMYFDPAFSKPSAAWNRLRAEPKAGLFRRQLHLEATPWSKVL